LPETNEVKDEVVSKEADSSSTAVQVDEAKPVEAEVKADDANISNVTSSSEAAPTAAASNAVAHPEPVAVVMEAPAIPEVAAVAVAEAEPASASEPSPVIHPATSSSDAGKIDESQMADADGKYILNLMLCFSNESVNLHQTKMHYITSFSFNNATSKMRSNLQ
jgi:hypothetical protein